MEKFLTSDFWFTNASLMPRILDGLLVLFCVLILLAILVRLVVHYSKGLAPWLSRSLRKGGRMFSTMGVLGLALVFFNYEGVPYLSARFWYILWLVGLVAWIVYIVVHVRKRSSQDSATGQQMSGVEKYLPR